MTEHDSSSGSEWTVPYRVAAVLTWRIAVEIVRRHPDELWIVQTYPTGFYDCLSIRRLQAPMIAPSIDFNRLGTAARISWLGPIAEAPQNEPILRWPSPYADQDPREWLQHVERSAGLKPSKHTPPSTPSSIALRWIGAFMNQQLGARRRWRADNTWFDGPAERYLPNYPAAATFAEQFGDGGTAHVWLLSSEDGTRNFAVCADGTLHQPDRDPVDLLRTYRENGSSMIRLLAATAADLLE